MQLSAVKRGRKSNCNGVVVVEHAVKRVEEEGDCQGKVDSLFSAGKRREGIFAGKRREKRRQGVIIKRDNLRDSNG